MDAVSDPEVETVVVMSSSQVGKTESFINNAVGYFIHQDPSPMLVINPTLEMSRTWSKDRFAPMLRDTPVLKGLVKEARSKDSDNTILHKSFPGGHITMAGANSASSLAARPVRALFLDEIDRFPESAGSEGDPVDLAIKRTTTFWNRKKLLTSTPTIKGASRIEAAFAETDQRKYFVPCPQCDEYQVLDFKNLKWDKEQKTVPADRTLDKAIHKPETAHFVCQFCAGIIEESDRKRMTIRGEWRATKPFTGAAGFWINELYSPWVSWADFVKSFLTAKKFPETLKVFTNTSLAETWEEKGEGLEKAPLFDRREKYESQAPDEVLVITMSVDTQDDRLELEFKGWGIDEEVWGLGYHKIFGDPARVDVWNNLDNYINKTFRTASGVDLRVECVAIDSGGHHTEMVYDFCKTKQRAGRMVYPIKGSSERGQPLVSSMSKKGKQNVNLFILGTDTGKSLISGRLQIEEPGPGYCHFPTTYDEDYFKGLTAEHCVTRFIKGIASRRWVLKQGHKRNEPLDLTVYNFAAFKILDPQLEILASKRGIEIKRANKEGDPAIPNKKAGPGRETKRPFLRTNKKRWI